MPGLGADGSGFIEESSAAAMSDTTLDCKLQKAGVRRHIGTGRPKDRRRLAPEVSAAHRLMDH